MTPWELRAKETIFEIKQCFLVCGDLNSPKTLFYESVAKINAIPFFLVSLTLDSYTNEKVTVSDFLWPSYDIITDPPKVLLFSLYNISTIAAM